MMWWDGDWSPWGWFFMMLWMVAFWGLVIWAVVALVRHSAGGSPRERPREKSAREILDERLARGEIDEDEYRARLGLLERL